MRCERSGLVSKSDQSVVERREEKLAIVNKQIHIGELRRKKEDLSLLLVLARAVTLGFHSLVLVAFFLLFSFFFFFSIGTSCTICIAPRPRRKKKFACFTSAIDQNQIVSVGKCFFFLLLPLADRTKDEKISSRITDRRDDQRRVLSAGFGAERLLPKGNG